MINHDKVFTVSPLAIVFHSALILVLVGFITLPKVLMRKINTNITVGDKYIDNKSGLINKRTSRLRLERVDSVDVEEGLMGGILGYGTIILRTGSSDKVYKQVGSVHELKSLIEERL